MLRPFFRRIDQLRRQYSQTIGRWFYKTIGHDPCLSDTSLPIDQIKHILVLRNNKRIGNMYFLLPFMHGLRRLFPHAKIELMLIDASQTQVFEHVAIDQIHVSHFSFRKAGAWLRMLREQRQVVYDLILMPHGSATDMLLGALLHARNKVTDRNEENVVVYRHAIEVRQASPHAALTPLALLAAMSNQSDIPVEHHMVLTTRETQAAQATVTALRGSSRYCIAYFRGARGKKVIPDPQWRQIREDFDQCAPGEICWVEILSPDITRALWPQTQTWQSGNLRELAAFLAACDLFICGDTGPLHLADAAGALCVGLFNATSPTQYGCLGQACANITDITQMDHMQLLQNAIERRPMSAHAS